MVEILFVMFEMEEKLWLAHFCFSDCLLATLPIAIFMSTRREREHEWDQFMIHLSKPAVFRFPKRFIAFEPFRTMYTQDEILKRFS